MNARETSLKILLEFEQQQSRLDVLFEKHLDRTALPARERKFVFNLVSGVVRYLTLLDWKIAYFFKGNYKKSLNNFKIILRLALYELDFLKHIPPHATVNEYVSLAKKRLPSRQYQTINGILRTYLREGRGLDPFKKFKYSDTRISVKYAFPEWLIKRWLGFWDEAFVQKLCESMNERPVFDVRVNSQKTDPEKFRESLTKNNITFSLSDHFPNIFKISDIQGLVKSGLLQKGICTIQDESGYLVSQLVKPEKGGIILDACAAPGGKYTALLEAAESGSVIIALEYDQERLKKIRENCLRLDLSRARIVQGDARLAPFPDNFFDRLLVDVPCSGLGTIQKNPDIKWRRTLEEIMRFQEMQLEMLKAADRILKPGGQLVYSTCTIDPAENEGVVESFLEENGSRYRYISPPPPYQMFSVENKYIRTFPHLHKMEGSFAAILQKLSS